MGYFEVRMLKQDWEAVEDRLSFYAELEGIDPLDENIYIVSLPPHLIDFDKILKVEVGGEYIEIGFQGWLHDFPDIEVCGEVLIRVEEGERHHSLFGIILKEVLNL